MTKTVLITGAGGNIGAKLNAHFRKLGWTTRLLDVKAQGNADVIECDLGVWDESWVRRFDGVDAVIHLAGQPSPAAPWSSIGPLNIDLTLNVYEAAVRQGAKRLVFASSNWTVAGHRFADFKLTTDVEPNPVNPYGVSKLIGERLGRSYHDRWGLSVICFRIGYCQRGDNRPGPHMGWGDWGQLMWLSDRDMCNAMERAVLAEGVGFAVLNLMSDNPGMRWDIETTKRVIGYAPRDGQAAVTDAPILEAQSTARITRELSERLTKLDQARRW
jgi:NAD+ dependent glucose-6-phosphate dehydrogenase